MSLFAEPQKIALSDGEISLFGDVLPAQGADQLVTQLIQEIEWQQPQIRIAGRMVKIPRLQAWHGDPDSGYQYSGLSMQPNPWTELLAALKSRVENLSGCHFNSVLVNRYRDGNDSVGWHSDDEPELGRNPNIASLSLGATRTFRLQHNKDKLNRLKIELEHGSLLLMQGALQHHWRHQIPKTMRPVGERINLTFRKVITRLL